MANSVIFEFLFFEEVWYKI